MGAAGGGSGGGTGAGVGVGAGVCAGGGAGACGFAWFCAGFCGAAGGFGAEELLLCVGFEDELLVGSLPVAGSDDAAAALCAVLSTSLANVAEDDVVSFAALLAVAAFAEQAVKNKANAAAKTMVFFIIVPSIKVMCYLNDRAFYANPQSC